MAVQLGHLRSCRLGTSFAGQAQAAKFKVRFTCNRPFGSFFVGVAAFTAALWVVPAYPAPAPQLRNAAIIGYVWWAYLLAMVLLVGLAKGMRLSMAALVALMVWINFGIIFIGTMAVEGNWIWPFSLTIRSRRTPPAPLNSSVRRHRKQHARL